ncbi:MAG: serine hydrolase domain-containing protein [Vicinamibacterales bacterium]|nr:serine hydrolase domain-containing protein [Vicinamibacterales bacterium]
MVGKLLAGLVVALGMLTGLGFVVKDVLLMTAPLHTEEAPPSRAAAPPAARWARAVEASRRLADTAVVDGNLPGVSVAVGVGGEIVWAEGVGWADLEQRIPMTPKTRFRIGTASTALTSAAVGLLLEDDRLTLDESIQTYVPQFPAKQAPVPVFDKLERRLLSQPVDTAAWPVTLRQVMGHVAGVRPDGGDEGPLFSVRCERPVDALPYFADRSLLFAPGTRYRFSSYGWILVSAAVEAAADEPFLAFMQRQIFEPLGMNDTMADSATESIPERATFYFPRFGADPLYGQHLMRPLDYSCYAGASVFLSTPSDLVRFGLAITGGRLLQPATVQRLQTSQRLASGQETGYGLGWDVEIVSLAGAPTRQAGHDGESLGGTVASFMTFPDLGIVVAVTSNISYAQVAPLALAIAETFARDAGAVDQRITR